MLRAALAANAVSGFAPSAVTNLAREEETVTQTQPDTRDIALALGLDAGADTPTIISAINRQQTPDPEKYVPIGAVKDLLADRAGHMSAN